MATLHVFAGSHAPDARPTVRRIGFADLGMAIARGLDDFRAMPSHVIFLSLLYPLVGLVLARLSFGYDLVPLLFPLTAGFALIGPFVALGLYEMSRRREQGVPTSWRDAFAVLRNPSIDSIALLGGLLMVLFVIWLAVADALYVGLFGHAPPESLGRFLTDVFTTEQGRTLLLRARWMKGWPASCSSRGRRTWASAWSWRHTRQKRSAQKSSVTSSGVVTRVAASASRPFS